LIDTQGAGGGLRVRVLILPGLMIIVGSLAAFLITVPKEAITHEHQVIAE
jgi:hypothetical protein